MTVQAELKAFLILMSEERSALRDARFDMLAEIHARKTEMIETLSLRIVAPGARARLRQELVRNQALMAAAAEGVAAARSVLARLGAAHDHLTYRANGARDALATSARQLERKA